MVRRCLLFFLFWLVLTEAAVGGLAFGAVAAPGAALLSCRLTLPATSRPRPWRLLGLVPHFLWQSFVGGADVARRVFHPALPLKPGWLVLPARLPPGTPRVLLSSEITLWPGTVFAGVRHESFLIHCLDTDQPVEQQIIHEERRFMKAMDDG